MTELTVAELTDKAVLATTEERLARFSELTNVIQETEAKVQRLRRKIVNEEHEIYFLRSVLKEEFGIKSNSASYVDKRLLAEATTRGHHDQPKEEE